MGSRGAVLRTKLRPTRKRQRPPACPGVAAKRPDRGTRRRCSQVAAQPRRSQYGATAQRSRFVW